MLPKVQVAEYGLNLGAIATAIQTTLALLAQTIVKLEEATCIAVWIARWANVTIVTGTTSLNMYLDIERQSNFSARVSYLTGDQMRLVVRTGRRRNGPTIERHRQSERDGE